MVGGKDPLVPEENDKPLVIALREIEEGLINNDPRRSRTRTARAGSRRIKAVTAIAEGRQLIIKRVACICFEPESTDSNLPAGRPNRLRQAHIQAARDAHEGQTRSSGEPYITHPVKVTVLAEDETHYETLIMPLHDVIEDTATYQTGTAFGARRRAGR